ncbi:tetratricopeptide repeat protein [Mycobacterium sp. KBS0706]|uniref:tetratricopeptide repeat protein n=1 Tax=Mycobacterium sp. KBS0706 TaxID=2578109 RepID=UPI00163D7F73|nr:tetratricopeptide repeat protein [Mycobacterium sp. KBS0706]
MMEVASSSELPGSQSAAGSFIAQATAGGTAIVAVYQAAAPRPVAPAEVAAAETLLATMPLGVLPEPGSLPPASVLPWPRNRYFVGRERDLCTLARLLKEGGAAAVGQSPAVTGMGGQGKTQLAVEFAYRFGRWFAGGVFWVNCADPAGIPDAIAACGLQFYPDHAGFSARPLPERVALVASGWAGPLPRLLIFDNCEDENLLDAWAPKSGGSRLLLTARRASWSPARGITAVPLGLLSPAESLTLLRRHRPDLEPDDRGLTAIAEELGNLPLALELAGSYLARYRDDPIGVPAAYLAELRSVDVLAHASMKIEDPEAPGRSRTLTGHERDVARTFEVSLCRLRPNDPVDALARNLLILAAWLAPGEVIPRRLLKLCGGIAQDDLAGALQFADALNRLLDLSLLERSSPGGVVMHRLVAAFARSRMEQSGAARNAVEATVGDEALRLLKNDDPRPLHDWSGHLLAVAVAARRDGTGRSVQLLAAAGGYSMLVADFGASQAILREAVEQAKALLGPDHIAVAEALRNLGLAQQKIGTLATAEASHKQALAIEEKFFGPDNLEIVNTLGNLGAVLFDRGRLAAAEAIQRRVLEIKERAYGPDHPEVAKTLDHISLVHWELDDLGAAEALQRRALEIKEKTYGPDHPEVARTVDHLGIVQRESGDLASAEASHRRALTIHETVYGPDHPKFAATLSNLGIVQADSGDLAAAEASQNQALAIQEKAYGQNHPEVARTLLNIGNLQRDTGATAEARSSYERATAIFSAELGEQHLHTRQARRLLGELIEKASQGED